MRDRLLQAGCRSSTPDPAGMLKVHAQVQAACDGLPSLTDHRRPQGLADLSVPCGVGLTPAGQTVTKCVCDKVTPASEQGLGFATGVTAIVALACELVN